MKQFQQFFNEMYIIHPREREKSLDFLIATSKSTHKQYIVTLSPMKSVPMFIPFTGRFIKKLALRDYQKKDLEEKIKGYPTYNFEFITKEVPYIKRQPGVRFKQFLFKAFNLMKDQFSNTQWTPISHITIPQEVEELYREYYKNMRSAIHRGVRGVTNNLSDYGDRKARFIRSLTRLGFLEMKKDENNRWVVKQLMDPHELVNTTDPNKIKTGVEYITDLF